MPEDPIAPNAADAFPASRKMHEGLAKFLASEESMKMTVSEVEAIVWTRGQEFLEKMKEEAFAMLDKAQGNQPQQTAPEKSPQ